MSFSAKKASCNADNGNEWQSTGNLRKYCGKDWQWVDTSALFSVMPGRPFQSSLEPHLEIIRTLRLKRRTWRQVAEVLETEHGLEIDPAAIYKFFKRRVRPSARQPLGFPESVNANNCGHSSESSVRPSVGVTSRDAPVQTQPRSSEGAALMPAQSPVPQKYVFTPKPKTLSRFSEKDLEFNDPLA